MTGYLLLATIAWYVVFEFLLCQMRRHRNFPTTATFTLGLLQSVGFFVLALSATVTLFFK